MIPYLGMVISVPSSQDTEIYKDIPSPVCSFVEDLDEIIILLLTFIT